MTTKTIDLQTTDTDLQALLSLVSEGTEVILTRGDTPIARVSPLEESAQPIRKPRIPGLGVGDVLYISDDFDDPLPDLFWLGEEG